MGIVHGGQGAVTPDEHAQMQALEGQVKRYRSRIAVLKARPPLATREGCTTGEFAVRTSRMTVFCHVNSETDGDADWVVATINGEDADV